MTILDRSYIQEQIKNEKDNLIRDIASLVEIPSIRHVENKYENAPFGKDIRDAFDMFIKIATREGLLCEDFEGFALHAEYGKGDEIIGILGHLDIVPIFEDDQWNTDPFKLVEIDGHLYGRGVNDDKAPLIAALYALKILKEANVEFKRRVRLIIGGAEETTWECMEHYFSNNPQPIYSFSPDGDFPIVNGEKGIINYTYTYSAITDVDSMHNLIEIETKDEDGFVCDYAKVTFKSSNIDKLKELLKEAESIVIDEEKVIVIYTGLRALSRNPHRGINALFKLGKDLNHLIELNAKGQYLRRLLNQYFLDDVKGEKVNLYDEDEVMGFTTLCLKNVNFRNEEIVIHFDFRYPKSSNKNHIKHTFEKIAEDNQIQLTITKELDVHYVSPESVLIKNLQMAYKNVTGEDAELFSKGGASYARTLKEGVVFGPTFIGDTPNTHKANENIKLQTLFKAIEIYCEAIYLLACK
ncbi:Sapep family Mn(2+)-dependent dipeptidase [Neobacillus sp.]|uniref:Sapep family Mn(2+)-dependent dipeptidase n=1 Tax=Neobacillus sp. TaxID=2675273 RepID=UPI0028A17CBE|nr:Sapep family Mn(2+)-dependent dipeptidase [Neobacillus sp.]